MLKLSWAAALFGRLGVHSSLPFFSFRQAQDSRMQACSQPELPTSKMWQKAAKCKRHYAAVRAVWLWEVEGEPFLAKLEALVAEVDATRLVFWVHPPV